MTHAFVPRNLDMSLFGDKADKIAIVLERLYRMKIYTNSNGYVQWEPDYGKAMAISMKCLTKALGVSATRIMDLICQLVRHQRNETQPIEKVLIRVKPAKRGVHAALYAFAKPYRVRTQRQCYAGALRTYSAV